jgi:hypothetical protein
MPSRPPSQTTATRSRRSRNGADPETPGSFAKDTICPSREPTYRRVSAGLGTMTSGESSVRLGNAGTTSHEALAGSRGARGGNTPFRNGPTGTGASSPGDCAEAAAAAARSHRAMAALGRRLRCDDMMHLASVSRVSRSKVTPRWLDATLRGLAALIFPGGPARI